MRKKFLLTMFSLVLFAFCGTSLHATDGNVAKVGNTEYATIDEAIADWTNGSTLTLLADVTLSDVIQLSSTEHHILDLGTYTMTAASKKDAIQIVNNGRSSASYALDIKADATNPGGITASGKAVVKTTGKSGVKDRPIIRFYGGVFTGTNVVYHSGSNGTNCPQFWFYGGEFNGTVYANRALFQFYGGTFNGSIQISVDSSAYALVSGGRFKKLSNQYGSALNSDKFTIGSAKGNYNRSIYVDKDGYYVVTSEVITEVSAKYPAVKKEGYTSNNYFYYSAANTYGMFYEVASMAPAGSEVWTKPAVTIPAEVEGDATVVEEIKNNTALNGYTPENLPENAELEIELVSVGETFVFDVTPMADGAEVEPTEAITFRLPVPASVTEAYAKVYHEDDLMGIYEIEGEENAKYVEVSSADFSLYTVEPTTVAAKIGETGYATFAEALAAAKAMTGDVTVEIYEKVTLNGALTGNYTSIKFVGQAEAAEIYLDIQGYSEAAGKNVAFENLKLSKVAGGYITNAGFMNLAFGIYGATETTYTNCTFVNGAYASTGKVTFTGCTFYRSHDRYGLWAYGDVDAIVDDCTFADIRGIKMYAEGQGAEGSAVLTVKNTDFTAVNNKPAIVLTYGESVVLENNNYSSTGTFELDLDGKPNGVAVTSDVAPVCVNDNGACGVLVDGKIYTTVAQAKEVATSGSNVTLLHNSAETVEFVEGVVLNKNGFEAAGVTVAQPVANVAKVGDVEYADLQDAINAANGGTVILISDVTYTTVYANNKTHWNGDLNYELSVGGNVTLDLNGHTIKTTGGSSHSVYALICVRSGSLTVVDNSAEKTGAIICSAETKASHAYAIYNNGALTLNGGTVSNTVGNYAIESVTVKETALTINEGATVTSTGIAVRVCSQGSAGTQTVAINGGNLSGTYAMWVPVKNGGSDIINMTIAGGTFTGSSNAILFNTYTNGDFTTDNIAITGGTFNGNVLIGADYAADDANHIALSAALEGKVISGGTFSNDVSRYVADGYAIKNNGNGTFGIEEAPSEITVADNAELQAALDNCRAGITIKLTENVNYGVVYMRPTPNNPATKEVDWVGNNYRYETYTCYDNLTIMGANGATIDAIKIEGNTYYNTEHSQADTYPVMLSLIELKNVVVDGVTFTGKGGYDPQGHGNAINVSGNNIKVNGLTIKNCVLSDSENNARLLYKTESTTHVHTYTYGGETYTFTPDLKNITITGCTFKGGYMGLELRETEDLIISGNTFKGVTSRDMLLATNTDCTYSGELTITGNTSDGAGNRFVRASGVGAAALTIKDNVIVNYQGGDDDFIKADGITGTVVIENNKFDGEVVDHVFENGVLKLNTPVQPVAKIGETPYTTLAAAVAAVQEGETITILAGTLSEGTIKLPATLKNVTIKGAASVARSTEETILKDMTISAADGNTVNYEGLTFDGITFDNSNVVLTGWRTSGVVYKNITVNGCTFKNIVRTNNEAAFHINCDANEAVNGFTFTNNVIEGISGASNSGIYAQVTGEVKVENNVINNVAFRPYVIQVTTDDGVADNFTVTGNTFSGSSAGRAQGLGNNAEGTDNVNLVVSNNIFKGITNAQQICYWNFNAAKTTADLSGNYYDIDILANPGKIYYNSAATNTADLTNMGIFPIYTELNADGTINTESAYYPPVAKIGDVEYTSLQAAIEAVQEGETITLVDDVNVTTPAYGQNALNHAKAVSFTLDLNGKTLSANTGNSVFRFNIANSGATSNVTLTIKNGKIVAGSNTWCAVMASGISSDVKAIMNLENLTIESSKANDMAVKSWANATINAEKVTVNATNAAGGFYAVGGEIVLDECTVNQKGLYTAPYMSMAFAVSGNGKMTINSGTYSAEPTAAAEGNNQGTTHGSWVGGVMNSGGELIINGGTFSNGNFGDNDLATAARGLIFADSNGKVTVNGGTFNALKSIFDFQNNLGTTSPVITVKGGSYSADPTKVTSYGSIVLEEGYCVVKNNNVWTVERGLAGAGTEAKPYLINNVSDLKFFRDEVNKGVENKYNAAGVWVALNDDIDLAGINWTAIGSAATDHGFMGNFDGKTFKIKNLTIDNPALDSDGYAYAGLFGVTEGTDKDNQNTIKNLTIENVTINTTGDIVSAAIAYPYYTNVDNVKVCGDIKIQGGDYTAGVLAYTRRCVNASNLAIVGNDGSYVKGAKTVGGVISDIQMNGGLTAAYSNFSAKGFTITGEKQVGGISGIICKQTLNVASVKNVTLNCSNASVGIVSGSWGDVSTISNVTVENVSGATAIIGATWKEGAAVEARIGDTYYATLEAALEAEGNEVELLVPYVVAAGETVVLNLNGKTISQSKACTASYEMINNKGNLTITGNGKLSFTDTSAGDPSFGWGSYTVRNEGNLVVENGTIEHKGAQAFATHMICAIFQYSGSTTINGGTISTPNYRSARLWKGDMTINGGTFDGQLWVQAVDNTAELTINGGTFEPNGQDASAVFVTNSTYDVAFAVTDGTFNGKIGCSDTDKLAGCVTGGNFNEAAKNGTNAALLATGNVFGEVDANGYYAVVTDPTKRYIANAEQLKAFAAEANAGNTFVGVTVYLTADIDLEQEDWTPIAKFNGTFDGQNHTISNLWITGSGNLGFFNQVADQTESVTGTVKDVTFENATIVSTNGQAGLIADARLGARINNVNLVGEVTISGYRGVGGIVGAGFPVIDSCKVEAEGEITATYWGAGGILGFASDSGAKVNNSTVTGTGDGLTIRGELGGVGAVTGTPYGAATNGAVVKNVVISSSSDYYMAYVDPNGVAGDVTVENVAVKVNDNDIVGCDAVAAIGTTPYFNIADAFAAANENGGDITLYKNVTITSTLKVNAGKTITLDLNGKTIDGTEKVNIAIMSYGDLTIKDSSAEKTGVVKAGVGTAGNAINICAGTFTLESGNIYSKNNALLIDEQAAVVNIKGGKITAETATRNSAVMYISSTNNTVVNITAGELVGYNGILLWNNTEVNISGGEINATGSVAIQGNGSKDNTKINITGGEISGYYSAIYHPQGGELNISGGELTGWTGIVVKGGNVKISGGTIAGTGDADTYRPVSSGYVDTGDGLYVEHYDNSTNSENYGTPVVTVTGGTFTSANAKAIASYANTNNNVAALAGFVSGGTFDKEIDAALCAAGYVCQANGEGAYGVVVDPAYGMVAKIGETYYATIAEAVAAAQNGETIELIADAEVVADETVTLDGVNLSTLNGVTLTNNGTVEVKGEVSLNIATLAGSEIDFLDGAIIKNSTIGGNVFVAGDVTFRGANTFAMLYDYGTLTDYYGTTAPMKWTVEEGASVTLTTAARYGLGYGDDVTVYGNIENALTARENLTDADRSLFMHGLVAQESKGWNCDSKFTVENAYVAIGSNNSFGNKSGNYGGTYTFNIENSVVDASRITFYEASSTTTFTIDGSDVKMGTFMTRDADSKFVLKNSKVLSTTTSNGTDEGNYNKGELTLENSSLTYSAEFKHEAGVINLDLNSLLTAPKLSGAGTINVDATGVTIPVPVIKADMSDFTGTINVEGGIYEITSEGLVIKEKTLSGAGTEENPYLISNEEELVFFRDKVNSGDTKYNAPGVWVALAADIDLAGTTWTEGIGDGHNWSFDGNFDGKDHIIKNLTVAPYADANGYLCGGLFGYIYGGVTIKNLVIENATVEFAGEEDKEYFNVGVLVGFANNNGGKANISNITVKGDVKVNAPNAYGVGAIVGYSYREMGTIANCTVEANDDSYIKGHSFVGGITGYSYTGATIAGCSVKNLAITATKYSVGGIAGITGANNTVSNCVVENVIVNGEANVGNVVGAISADALVVENCTAAEPLVGGNYSDNKPVEARIGNKYYATLEGALAAAVNGETITMLDDVTLTSTVTVAGKTIILDLNGNIISGTCNAKQASLVYVENDAALTVKDSVGNGKITYAQGSSNVGWTVDVKGAFTLESGTIELTGSWSIGYAVDVRPNSWGTAYTNPTVFTMNGGNILSSDGGVRVASSSAAEHTSVSAAFEMNGGAIDAAWDGVFVQQSDAIYDELSFTMNGGTIESDLNPVRVYGPAATGYVNGQDCMNIAFNAGTMTYTGTESYEWIIEGILRVGGGSSMETILESGNIIATAEFANANNTLPEGYEWVASDDEYEYIVAPMTVVAKIGDVNYYDLQAAIDAAQNGATITMHADVALTEGVTVAAGKTVTLDLNGKTIAGTDNTTANFGLIQNNGTLTVNATNGGKMTVVATTDSGTSRYSAVISNNPGATLTVNGGTLEHRGGTYMAYGIDALTNGNIGDVNTTINGGTIKSTYRAVRQFLNSDSKENNLTVNGGTLVGVNKSIFFHDPSAKANKGTVTVSEDAVLNGDVYLFVTAGSTEWPVEVAIANAALAEGSKVVTGNVPENYEVDNYDGTWRVKQVAGTLTRTLKEGWSWFSSYVSTDLAGLKAALTGDAIVTVKNSDAKYVSYDGTSWSGKLTSVNPTQMYMIKTSEDYTMNINGDFVEEGLEIYLEEGWNWISYPLNKSMAVNDALAGFDAANNDVIKDKSGNQSRFYESKNKWIPSIDLQPGEGYMYYSNSTEEKTLVYSTEVKSSAKTATAMNYDRFWSVDAHQYPFNMTMVAMLDKEMMTDNYEIAAFANGECRGSSRSIYVEEFDAYMLFLTIHGENNANLTFKCYDVNTGEIIELNNELVYSNNAIVGSLNNPYVLTRGTVGIDEATISNINIYPNPTTTDREISLQAICDKVEVFNTLGVKVAEYQNVDSIDALETAGTYVIRVTVDGSVKHCRLIVK